MSTYAIGDIQGCLKPLKSLLNIIKFDPAKDQLWLVGDLVNRGPDTLETLRFLYRLRNSLKIVLGNHDLHMLAVHYGVRAQHKGDTFDDFLLAPDCAELCDWLRHQKLIHYDPTLKFTMVHAGIPPQWDLIQAQSFAQEVEAALQGPHADTYLSSMYGHTPSRWSDSLRGQDRLRIITNYFTRMRFCNVEGELELHTKENVDAAPPGFAPWFSFVERKTKDNNIVFGHWAALGGRTGTLKAFAIDTGCIWGGALTALRLEDQAFFSCRCP